MNGDIAEGDTRPYFLLRKKVRIEIGTGPEATTGQGRAGIV